MQPMGLYGLVYTRRPFVVTFWLTLLMRLGRRCGVRVCSATQSHNTAANKVYHLPNMLVHVKPIPLVDDCSTFRRDIICTLCRTFSFVIRCVDLVAHWAIVSRGVPTFVIICGPIDPRVALSVRLAILRIVSAGKQWKINCVYVGLHTVGLYGLV